MHKPNHLDALARKLKLAFKGLKLMVPERQIMQFAELIHGAMSHPARIFHTPEHVLSVCSDDNPIRLLAGLFHDIVYYQVDEGMNEKLRALLSLIIVENKDKVSISPLLESSNLMVQIPMSVFGVTAGQALDSRSGQNEFLSTLILAQVLKEYLAPVDLLRVAACIEATIPFRSENDKKQSALEVLRLRLESTNSKFNLGLTANELDDATASATILANADLANFLDEDIAHFLENTWKLIAETNPGLRDGKLYTTREYRNGISRMFNFFRTMAPERIVNRFQNTPPTADVEKMLVHIRRNMAMADRYLSGKLLAITLIEAIAVSTGGDAPLNKLLGTYKAIKGTGHKNFQDYLPEANAAIAGIDSEVLVLFEEGRSGKSLFDVRHSPLADFIFKRLGSKGVTDALGPAVDYISGQLPAASYLKKVDRRLLTDISTAMSKVCEERRERILELIS